MGVRAKKIHRQKRMWARARACWRVQLFHSVQHSFIREGCRLRSHVWLHRSASMSALDVVRGGKHSGSTYAVASEDRSYCHWILNATSLPRSLRPLRTWLQREYGGVLNFGKHKSCFYSEIYDGFPEYTIWACQLSEPSEVLRTFQQYCRRRDEEIASEEAASRQQPAPKRTRGRGSEPDATRQTSSLECKICYDRPIEVLIFPCKHLVVCQICGSLCSTCPLCRGPKRQTLRVFTG